MLLLVALAVMTADPTTLPTARPAVAMTRSVTRDTGNARPSMDARSYESDNFHLRSLVPGLPAERVAAECEQLRRKLWTRWFGKEGESWIPLCQVVLHPTESSYLRATGPAGEHTVGFSDVHIDRGQILARRIDLLVEDVKNPLAALPHELIHVLFAERFPDQPPPRWAEEGVALLNDEPSKQARHLYDLQQALSTKSAIPVRTLFTLDEYPSGRGRAVFYGESLSLVEYLTKRGSSDQFVLFIDLCMKVGHAQALKTIYKIDSAADLERQWRKEAIITAAAAIAAN